MVRGAADIYDWIAELKSNQWVLDVGSGRGSFPGAEFSCAWLALDDDPQAFTVTAKHHRAVGRSHQLPVAPGSIDLLICHHALEHLAPLDETLAEMARVLKPGGRCYLSIPNGYGLCDAVYRWGGIATLPRSRIWPVIARNSETTARSVWTRRQRAWLWRRRCTRPSATRLSKTAASADRNAASLATQTRSTPVPYDFRNSCSMPGCLTVFGGANEIGRVAPWANR